MNTVKSTSNKLFPLSHPLFKRRNVFRVRTIIKLIISEVRVKSRKTFIVVDVTGSR